MASPGSAVTRKSYDTGRRPGADHEPAVLTNVRAARVRAVAALARRSVRVREGLFLAEGPQAVREAVAFRPEVVRELYVDDSGTGRHPDLVAAARAAGIRVQATSSPVLAAMCDTTTPQGLLAVCRPVDVAWEQVLSGSPRMLVVLAQVRDPGNAGTVIRGADAAGADAVIFAGDCVDAYNPKAVRSAVGSHFHLPLVFGPTPAEVVAALREAGIRALAADGAGATSLFDVDLARPHAWVMGNEAWGLEDHVLQACDEVVAVPRYGHAESLNLAMATTVCLYSSAREQRHHRAGIG